MCVFLRMCTHSCEYTFLNMPLPHFRPQTSCTHPITDKKVVRIHNIMGELIFPFKKSTIDDCDNQRSTQLFFSYSKIKHVDFHAHYGAANT
jgi:hypothetical protein